MFLTFQISTEPMKSPEIPDHILPTDTDLPMELPSQVADVNLNNQPQALEGVPQNKRAVMLRHKDNNNEIAKLMLGLEIRVKDLSLKSKEYSKHEEQKIVSEVTSCSDSDGYVTCNDSELDEVGSFIAI